MKTVSVLINSYNYAHFVAEAVNSALAQSRVPDEIIVVDDGSTDDTLAVLAENFGSNPLVKVVHQRNSGQLAAFVTGFKNATGDFIFMLDADDRYQPNHIAGVMTVYEARRDVDFVFTGLQEFGGRTDRQLFSPRDHYFGLALLRTFNPDEWAGAPTSALSCRRFVIDALLPLLQEIAPRWRIRADDCLVRGAGAVGARKYFLAVTTVDYRIHGANHFAAQDLAAASHREHWFRTICFFNRLHEFAGIDRRMLRWLHKEFVLIPEPRRGDFETYREILKRAKELPLPVRLGMSWRMRQHFRRHGRTDDVAGVPKSMVRTDQTSAPDPNLHEVCQ